MALNTLNTIHFIHPDVQTTTLDLLPATRSMIHNILTDQYDSHTAMHQNMDTSALL